MNVDIDRKDPGVRFLRRGGQFVRESSERDDRGRMLPVERGRLLAEEMPSDDVRDEVADAHAELLARADAVNAAAATFAAAWVAYCDKALEFRRVLGDRVHGDVGPGEAHLVGVVTHAMIAAGVARGRGLTPVVAGRRVHVGPVVAPRNPLADDGERA